MKNLILGMTSLFMVSSAMAHTIIGTPMKEETLKTDLYVATVPSTCKVKVDKVFNLKEEDTYGNPAYRVWINVNLSGSDVERKLKVKFKRSYDANNLFVLSNDRSEVRDYEYQSKDGLVLKMKTDGRLASASFLYNNQTITCSF